MKKIINAIIVVEGASDVAKLTNLIDAQFVITNGSAIDDKTIAFLKRASLTKDIIVFTDPDFPGLQIRSKIEQAIPSVKHVFIAKKDAISHHKVGVAEANNEAILKAFEHIYSKNGDIKGNLVMSDLFNLGLAGSENSKSLRLKLANEMNLGFVNSKSLLNRLNSLNITKDEIVEVLTK